MGNEGGRRRRLSLLSWNLSGEAMKNFVDIAADWIRTDHLQNTNQKRYRFVAFFVRDVVMFW